MPRSLPLLLLLMPLLSAHVPASQHPASRSGGKDYALFFAVETYDNNSAWKNLPGLIKECEDIRNDLVERYGFSSDSKVVRNPTLNDIAAELARWRSRSYDPDDQLLVFFSGHGQFLDDVQEGFFIPGDGKSKNDDVRSRNWYSLLTLPRHVTTIKCPHILLAIDACYSGTIDSQVALKNENEEWDQPANNGEAQFNQYVHDLLANKSRLLMTSGGKNRTKHPSDFVRWFREALATLGGQDRLLRPADIEERWPAATVGRPLSGTFEGHEPGGNFLFVYQPKATPAPPAVPPVTPPVDYDEDGTPDTTDKCPTEAGPAATKGCPDQDGDGVADKFDSCKTEKGPASNDGCPVETTFFKEYIVKQGNTIKSVALKFKVNATELAVLNGLGEDESLIPGKRLLIPVNIALENPPTTYFREYIVKKGDTLFAIASKFSVSINDLKQNNFPDGQMSIEVGQRLLIPIKN